jgi:hypothetical protein
MTQLDHHGVVHILDAATWRKRHMAKICELITERPEHQRVIFFGDFNDLPVNVARALWRLPMVTSICRLDYGRPRLSVNQEYVQRLQGHQA